MIETFANSSTQAVFEGQSPRQFPPNILRVAERKLKMIDAAADVRDLRSPPGNRLEALKGNRKGQYSIRINDQWRVCFTFEKDSAYNVEITDYH